MQPISPADFSHQDCRNRSFCCQDLSYANFQGADVRGADFSDACLIGANFTEAQFGQTRRQKLVTIILGCLALVLLVALILAFDPVYLAKIPFLKQIVSIGMPISILGIRYFFPNLFDVFGRVAYFIFLVILTVITVFLATFNILLAIAFFAILVWFLRNLTFDPMEMIPPTGTRFCDANLSQAIFCSTSVKTKLKNIDFSGAILADVDITHAWLIDIKGTHYFRDLERHDRAPAEGCFTPLAMLDALEQMKDHTKPVHHPGF